MGRPRLALFLLAAFTLLGVTAYYFVIRPALEIRARQDAFDSVSLEMNKSDVTRLLGVPNSTGTALTDHLYWDDDIRDDADPSTAVGSIRYSTRTFFLPVIFEFTFDANGLVIGKHRYD